MFFCRAVSRRKRAAKSVLEDRAAGWTSQVRGECDETKDKRYDKREAGRYYRFLCPSPDAGKCIPAAIYRNGQCYCRTGRRRGGSCRAGDLRLAEFYGHGRDHRCGTGIFRTYFPMFRGKGRKAPEKGSGNVRVDRESDHSPDHGSLYQQSVSAAGASSRSGQYPGASLQLSADPYVRTGGYGALQYLFRYPSGHG